MRILPPPTTARDRLVFAIGAGQKLIGAGQKLIADLEERLRQRPSRTYTAWHRRHDVAALHRLYTVVDQAERNLRRMDMAAAAVAMRRAA